MYLVSVVYGFEQYQNERKEFTYFNEAKKYYLKWEKKNPISLKFYKELTFNEIDPKGTNADTPVCCDQEMVVNHYVDEEQGRVFGYTCLECTRSIWDE